MDNKFKLGHRVVYKTEYGLGTGIIDRITITNKGVVYNLEGKYEFNATSAIKIDFPQSQVTADKVEIRNLVAKEYIDEVAIAEERYKARLKEFGVDDN